MLRPMGLREKKAARTREQILDAALGLFRDRGYDATTIEEIAEAAEVGSSTLYRYFPSKEAILTAPLFRYGLADALRARPADEPLAQSLGRAIHDALGHNGSEEQVLLAREILDRTPGPRARLWDLLAQERSLLEDAIAERMGREPDDFDVAVTALLVVGVIGLAADAWRFGDHATSAADVADDVMRRLRSVPLVLPQP